MANVQQYYLSMKAKREELAGQFLKGDCLVTSVANLDHGSTAGNVAEVPVPLAARLLIEGTHRLSSKEEQTAFKDVQAKQRATTLTSIALAQAARKQIETLLNGQPQPPQS
jgi:hypothetical protein